MSEDRLTLKNMLFTKAIPNHVISFPTNGYKIFPCTDCGDKFLFETSYEHHINRRALKITYMCRHCGEHIFFNRCKLLSHIRSHTFKTATINVSDLQIEPLPLPIATKTQRKQIVCNKKLQATPQFCIECQANITVTGVASKDRAKHYMQCDTRGIKWFTCPVCMFSLPNSCGLKAHLRIHLKQSPIFCPECGIHLSNKTVKYPYSHDCEGFNMIRATTRLMCYDKSCNIFHPNEYREHMKSHIRKVFKCPICSFKWFDEPPKTKHTLCNNGDVNIVCYFKCHVCMKHLTKSRINKHINLHFENNSSEFNSQVYPCRVCGNIYEDVKRLLLHQVKEHNGSKLFIESVMNKPEQPLKGIYKVIKRCEKCHRNFTYRCQYENIKILPSECPYKCSVTTSNESNDKTDHPKIVCFKCKNKININWKDIKTHFAEFHNTIKCVDVKVLVKKLDSAYIEKRCRKINQTKKLSCNVKRNFHDTHGKPSSSSISCDKNKTNNTCEIVKVTEADNKKRKVDDTPIVSNIDNVSDTYEKSLIENHICHKCNLSFDSKGQLTKHIITHRDPCTAYQCLECGQCFVVKPSFSTHLLLQHKISDVETYIKTNNCFNKQALISTQNSLEELADKPVEPNQCAICREKFQDQDSLEKHFRVHGMAFLMKNKLDNC